jgi:hypothetical protein
MPGGPPQRQKGFTRSSGGTPGRPNGVPRGSGGAPPCQVGFSRGRSVIGTGGARALPKPEKHTSGPLDKYGRPLSVGDAVSSCPQNYDRTHLHHGRVRAVRGSLVEVEHTPGCCTGRWKLSAAWRWRRA